MNRNRAHHRPETNILLPKGRHNIGGGDGRAPRTGLSLGVPYNPSAHHILARRYPQFVGYLIERYLDNQPANHSYSVWWRQSSKACAITTMESSPGSGLPG